MPERLGKYDCLPPGSINYDACHARDAEEIARLTRERDEARHEATQAHGVAQALERQVLSQQEACAKASLAVAELARERDEARAEVKHWRDAWAEAQVKLDTRPDVEAERDRLRALLREVEWVGRFYDEPACPVCQHVMGHRHTPDCRLAAALEGRDA